MSAFAGVQEFSTPATSLDAGPNADLGTAASESNAVVEATDTAVNAVAAAATATASPSAMNEVKEEQQPKREWREYPLADAIPLSVEVQNQLQDSPELCTLFELVREERRESNVRYASIPRRPLQCLDQDAKDFNRASQETLCILLQIDEETGNDKDMAGCVVFIDREDAIATALAYVDEVAEKLLDTLERELRSVFITYDAELYELSNVRALYFKNGVGASTEAMLATLQSRAGNR